MCRSMVRLMHSNLYPSVRMTTEALFLTNIFQLDIKCLINVASDALFLERSGSTVEESLYSKTSSINCKC